MHIRDRCRICAGLVYIDKRTCEVSLFESESKALWNVDIGKDSAEIQPQVTQALWEIYRPCDLCSALCECCNMSVTAAVA